MPLPTKKEDLEAMGYVFDNEAHCRGCGEPIEWWITPNDKKMPMSVVAVKDESKAFPQPIIRTERLPHWGLCSRAADFRKK